MIGIRTFSKDHPKLWRVLITTRMIPLAMIPMMRAPLPHMTSMMIMRKWHKTKCHSFTRRSCENGKQPIELKVKSEKHCLSADLTMGL